VYHYVITYMQSYTFLYYINYIYMSKLNLLNVNNHNSLILLKIVPIIETR